MNKNMDRLRELLLIERDALSDCLIEQPQQEIWKLICGTQDVYEVSNFGRVRSRGRCVTWCDGRIGRRRDRMLKPNMINGGYLQVTLYFDGKRRSLLVHRLVAQYFLSNPDSLPEVNHIDSDKTNNADTNLEWCTRKQNQEHAVVSGAYSPYTNSRMARKLTPSIVAEIRLLCCDGWSHPQIAEKFNLGRSTVGSIVRGERWKSP